MLQAKCIHTSAQMVFVYYIRACTAATAFRVAAVQSATSLGFLAQRFHPSLYSYWTPLALPTSSSSSLQPRVLMGCPHNTLNLTCDFVTLGRDGQNSRIAETMSNESNSHLIALDNFLQCLEKLCFYMQSPSHAPCTCICCTGLTHGKPDKLTTKYLHSC